MLNLARLNDVRGISMLLVIGENRRMAKTGDGTILNLI